MTKTAALNSFWTSFGMIPYEETSVPTGASAPEYPYITYQVNTDSFGAPMALSGSVWDRDRDGYSAVISNNRAAEKISKYLGRTGTIIPCDGGAVWIKPGSPFAQSMGDPSDDQIHRKLINIIVEFITEF